MLNCRQASRLLSESLDRPLPLRAKLALRMHLLMCGACTRFERQLRFLHQAMAALDAREAANENIKLSDRARERIRQLLRLNGQKGSVK